MRLDFFLRRIRGRIFYSNFKVIVGIVCYMFLLFMGNGYEGKREIVFCFGDNKYVDLCDKMYYRIVLIEGLFIGGKLGFKDYFFS